MKKPRCISILVPLSSLALVAAIGCMMPSPGDVNPKAHFEEQAAVDTVSGKQQGRSTGLDSVVEDGFATQYYSVSVAIISGGTSLEVSGSEMNPRTSEYERWSLSESVSGGTIERVCMRHANEWYLALRYPDGTINIERWQLGRTQGAYYSDLGTATTGIGIAVQTGRFTIGIENDSFLQAPHRPRPAISKTVIAVGLPLDPIVLMASEPDGRYLIMDLKPLGARQVVQIVLVASSANPALAVGDTVQLWDCGAFPELSAVTSIGQFLHPTRGRACVLGNEQAMVCLWDSQNDGIFESSTTFTDLYTWYTQFPSEGWSRSF